MKPGLQKGVRRVARRQLAVKKKFRKWARKGIGKKIYSNILYAQKEARRNLSRELARFREEQAWKRGYHRRQHQRSWWWQYP